MPAPRQPDDFEFPRVEFREADGSLVAFGAGGKEEGLVQARRGEGRETLGGADDGRGEHAGEEVVEVCGVRGDGLGDFWVAVSDQTGHLARGPV